MQATRTTDKKRQSQIRTLKVKSPVLLPHGFVLVSKKRYEQLLEDINDLAVIVERRNEGLVSWEDVKKRLKKDGLL